MRAFLRTSPRTGISMPFWLAVPLLMLWGALMLLYLMGLIMVFAAQSAWLGGRWCWRRAHRR